VRCIGREPGLTLARVTEHANWVAQFIVAEEDIVHGYVLLVPIGIIGGSEEGGHVIGDGSDDVVWVFADEVLVHKVVQGDIEPSRSKHTPSTCTLSTKGDPVHSVTFIIGELVEAWGWGSIVSGEVLVGLGPQGIHSVEDSLSLELVETLDGVLGVNGIAKCDVGAGKVGHAFRSSFEAKPVLALADYFLDLVERFVDSHAFQGLLEEGGSIVD
jgi:hypothetical protein